MSFLRLSEFEESFVFSKSTHCLENIVIFDKYYCKYDVIFFYVISLNWLHTFKTMRQKIKFLYNIFQTIWNNNKNICKYLINFLYICTHCWFLWRSLDSSEHWGDLLIRPSRSRGASSWPLLSYSWGVGEPSLVSTVNKRENCRSLKIHKSSTDGGSDESIHFFLTTLFLCKTTGQNWVNVSTYVQTWLTMFVIFMPTIISTAFYNRSTCSISK